jgi:hemerythrin-like metal-binding protein
MEGIEWAEIYSVNVKAIDTQHKKLVAITNNLFQSIMDENGDEIVLDVLHELSKYAAYHFDFEEQLMREHGYPAVALHEHIQEHEALKQQVYEFIEECASSSEALDLSVFAFLRTWMDEHLRQTDALYKDFFKEKGVE